MVRDLLLWAKHLFVEATVPGLRAPHGPSMRLRFFTLVAMLGPRCGVLVAPNVAPFDQHCIGDTEGRLLAMMLAHEHAAPILQRRT